MFIPCRFLQSLMLASAAAASIVSLAGCGKSTTKASPTPSLTISTTSLPDATADENYSASLAVSGGQTPYTCTVTTGALPSGLTFGKSDCTISGRAVVAGTQTFTVTATDSSETTRTGTAQLSIKVYPPVLKLVSPMTLDPGAVGIPYQQAVLPSGGVSPYSCSTVSGALQNGLTLNQNCVVSGTPTNSGNASITINVTDSSTPAQTVTGTVNLNIEPTPKLRVIAGNEFIVGASVKGYAAGTTGNGSAPTLLFTLPVTDDVGGFTLPAAGSYTCPTPDSIVYLVATGGKAGSGADTNAGTALMTSVGACSRLETTSNLVINEVTTAAAAFAFAQFMKAGAQIGAPATNLSGITLAAGTFQNLADIATGGIPGGGFPPTGTAPAEKLNLMANLINGCIISSSATGPACSEFFSGAAVGGIAPANTLDAVMNLAQHPGTSVTALYAMASAAAQPYTPIPATEPPDWTLHVNFEGGGMNDPTAVSIDSLGRVWVANYFSVASLFSNTGSPMYSGGLTGSGLLNSYGGAVDKNDSFWITNEQGGPSGLGTVTVFNSQGQNVSGSPYSDGGLDFPISVAHDTSGTAWIVDYGNSHVTLLSNSGSPLSGASGYTTSQFIFPVAVAVDSQHQGWIANQSSNTITRVKADGSSFTSYVVGSGPSAVAVDGSDNVWSSNYYGDSIGLVSSNGTVLSGSGFVGGGVVHPQGIAIDGAGTAWVANYRGSSLSALAGASAAVPGAPLSPSAGFAPDANLLEAFGIAIDAAGNMWVTNFGNNILTEFVGMAVPVKTPLIGPVQVP